MTVHYRDDAVTLYAGDCLDVLGSHLNRLEQEWSAQAAAPTTPTGEAAGSPAQTDTSLSALTAATCSNIVTSWRRCWVELCELTSTSTTAITSETTTALTILSSSLSKLTGESTPPHKMSQPGLTHFVTAVDSLFAAAVLHWRATHALSAVGVATSSTPPASPAEVVRLVTPPGTASPST